MRTSLAGVVLTLSAVLVSPARADDFRGHNWGATMQEVRAKQGVPADTSQNLLTYADTIGTLDCAVAFQFSEGRLVLGAILFRERHSDDNAYISDFEKISKILKQKYGEPTDDRGVVWKNPLFRDDRSHWGTALSAGHMTMVQQWRTSSTTISHIAHGDNFAVSHAIRYISNAAAPALDEAENKEARDKL